MKKNECAQEMILELVLREGCEVTLRPAPGMGPGGGAPDLELIVRRRGYNVGKRFDLSRLVYLGERAEEYICCEIEDIVRHLFTDWCRGVKARHFKKEATDQPPDTDDRDSCGLIEEG